MPQLAVGGPLGELHLGDELRLHPVRRSLVRGDVANGLRLRLQRLQLLPHAPELRVAEAGTGVPDVAQAPRPRRTTPSSSAPKNGREPRGSVQPPTTQVCARTSFSLRQSGERRARHVERVEPLGDEPFPALIASRARAVARPSPTTCSLMRSRASRTPFSSASRPRAALAQRKRPQVLVAVDAADRRR